MPVRATKRGPERTPLNGDWDVVVCGASFAGLAAATRLAGAGARVLVLDRYEIGERQTSACATPSLWLERLGLEPAIRQRFDAIVAHTPRRRARWPMPWEYCTFDYPHLCALLWEQCDARFETATVRGTGPAAGRLVTVRTDRGDVTAPLVLDALGWRRVLGAPGFQPPDAPLSRGLEAHPAAASGDLEIWLDPRYVESGYSWSFPAADEVRVGVGSFDPRRHVKDPTVRLHADLGLEPEGWQGNWIPHALRAPVEDGIFFAGDSAGHCFPLTAEGIRTALYFGLAAGDEMRAVLDGRQDAGTARRRYAELSEGVAWDFRQMRRVQRAIRRLHGAPLDLMVRAFERERISARAFGHYLALTPPPAEKPAGATAGVAFAA